MSVGDRLDGEGGYTVYGKLVPAETSLQMGALPIGLAHNLRLTKNVSEGDVVKWNDVEFDSGNEAIGFRLEMEAIFRQEFGIKNPAL